MPAQRSVAYPYPSQRVVVLRHGERRDNHPDAPAESNPPLTPEGVVAIRSTAARLKHYLGEEEARAAVLIVSPFLRTVQTAESLQHHGVGTAHAMVVDNTLCEVFGPSRIKANRAPQLQAPPTSRAVGGLPVWGESIETAAERYVANFLRNGDAYGGSLARSTDSDAPLSVREDSQVLSSLTCPAAVTRRSSRGRASTDRDGGTVAAPGSLDSPKASGLKTGRPYDVILVTHGDAISSVLSHFYPARIVYEADFLSFIIMRRYGYGNHVYHLDESAGVNWFVEGIDQEPQDSILCALEVEREAAAAKNGGAGKRKNNNQIQTNEAVEIDEDFDDDEGEALDDCEEEELAHPESFAGGRMRSRASRLPPRRIQPRMEVSTHQSALTLTRAHPSLQSSPHPLATNNFCNTNTNNNSGSYSDDGGQTQPQLRHAGRIVGSAHVPSQYYPKTGEGCEKIRLPSGTLAQSSSSPVSTMDDSMDHHCGHTSRRGSGSTSTINLASTSRDHGNGVATDSDRSSGIVNKGGEEGSGEQALELHSSPTQPPSITAQNPVESSVPLRWSDGKQGDAFPGSLSSCDGLTAECNTNSWTMQQERSINLSALTERERRVRAVHVPSELPEEPSATQAENLIALATLPALTGTTPTPSSTSAPVSAMRTMPPSGSAGFSPPMQPVKGCDVRSNYGITSPRHCDYASFTDSPMQAQPCTSATPAVSVTSEFRDSEFQVSVPRLVRRIALHKAMSKAMNVSFIMRAVCLLLVIITTVALHGQLSLVWYCALAVVWEIVSAVVLALSCLTKSPHLLCARRAVGQLRFFQGACPSSVARSSNAQGLANFTVAVETAPMAARVDEDGEDHYDQFQNSTANGMQGESSTLWQVRRRSLGDDDAPHGAYLPTSGHTLHAVVLCVRHVAATTAKVLVLYLLSVVGGLMSGGDAVQVWYSVGRLFSTPAGLALTLIYGCANVVRGVWDETRVDAVLDQR
ncbi:hypothetical protein ABL78_4851 [Leptomonas seymouri]|uniref:Uncharacterized protein n=1 Tax=Leptomonas seymouri TaxID=5684 RepID=A0A0N1HXM5_LEPSE|nr:hypothetical protein ABL78_4851 [Leptomonas seymouri]|eukprot:KPI86090.1 hypothetical protein ABL78_4851 [Leptomonas seymouri]